MSGVKWGRLAGMIVLGLVLAGMVWWWLSGVAADASEPAPAAQSESSDPWGGVPWCTDEIADAGGICHGEPTAEPNGLADAAVEPVKSTSDWRAGYVPCETPTGSTMTVGCYWDEDDEHYVVTDDGEKFIIDPATGERTYAGVPTDYPPLTLVACPTEDSDNCYWDADAFGNGQGTDFVTIGGVTYYPEVSK